MKGFAPGLALEQRRNATRKSLDLYLSWESKLSLSCSLYQTCFNSSYNLYRPSAPITAVISYSETVGRKSASVTVSNVLPSHSSHNRANLLLLFCLKINVTGENLQGENELSPTILKIFYVAKLFDVTVVIIIKILPHHRVLKCDLIILQIFPFELLDLIKRYIQLLLECGQNVKSLTLMKVKIEKFEVSHRPILTSLISHLFLTVGTSTK